MLWHPEHVHIEPRIDDDQLLPMKTCIHIAWVCCFNRAITLTETVLTGEPQCAEGIFALSSRHGCRPRFLQATWSHVSGVHPRLSTAAPAVMSLCCFLLITGEELEGCRHAPALWFPEHVRVEPRVDDDRLRLTKTGEEREGCSKAPALWYPEHVHVEPGSMMTGFAI